MINMIKIYEKQIENIKTIKDLIVSYTNFLNFFSCKPDEDKFPKYKTGDIIDEDKSVKWNREEVQRCIAARDDEVKRLNREKAEINKLYRDTLIKWLADDNGISIAESEVIWKYVVYGKNHICGLYEAVAYYEELVEVYENLQNAKQKK